MSVFQRGDGRWVVKYKDSTGKRIQKTFKEKEDARSFNDELYIDSREGSRLTVFEAVTLYLKDHDYLCKNVQSQYSWLVAGSTTQKGRSVGPAECIADKYVDELTRRDFNDVRDNCRSRGCKNITINGYMAKLQTAFRYCASEGLLPDDPWRSFAKLRTTVCHMDGTIEDFWTLYVVLPEWMQWWCRTAMALCLRPGLAELFSLKWGAFDFSHGSVTVHMGKVDRDKVVYPIKEYMDEAWTRFLADRQDREQPVCRNKYGHQVKNYRATWRHYCRLAGVKLPPYAMRHITATMMLKAGADVAAVAANLGHANPSITLKTYAHALPSAQKEACSKMGAAWCKNEEKDSMKSIG